MPFQDDTIFALATAPGRAGIAIIRLSGGNSVAVLTALGGRLPAPRSSRLCRIVDGEGSLLDEALVLSFEGGASYTGDAVVELHLHGSMAVVRAVLSAIEETGLARLAQPGEFTRRALLSGRLDLAQVQGIGDLIDAETESQRRQAMRFLSGEMSGKVAEWRRNLIRAISLIEATIDFADEDVPVDVGPEVDILLATVQDSLEHEVRGAAAAAKIRQGFEVALVGAPNVGKSSLLNRMSRSDAAIVSEIAGTTRDVIEVRLDVAGLSVALLDTAGIRDTTDPIESLGVRRAIDRAEAADLRLFLSDVDGPRDWPLPPQPDDLFVRTKIDLDGSDGVSSLTGAGIDGLLMNMAKILETRTSQVGLVSNERDERMMRLGAERLSLLRPGIANGNAEFTSVAIRDILADLQSIIGGVNVEAILDEVFASFCIGK